MLRMLQHGKHAQTKICKRSYNCTDEPLALMIWRRRPAKALNSLLSIFPESWYALNVKTTLQLPDALYREVKAKAALDGCRVTDLVIQGLQFALGQPAKTLKRVQFPLIPFDPNRPAITAKQVAAAESEVIEAEAHGILMRY